MKCPKCKSNSVRRSRDRVKGILSLVFVYARCRDCLYHFRTPIWRVPVGESSSLQKRAS